MNIKLQVVLLLALVLYFYILFHLLKKKRLNLKYTLLWIFAGIVMLLVDLFPNVLRMLTKLAGIAVPSNALFAMVLFFVLMILMTLTSIVSKLNEQVKRLTQTIALLEKQLREVQQQSEI